jgi:hypothetical protein
MAAKRTDDTEDGLEALFAAPPKAFVAERARLVAALKAAGRTDEARAVAARKRPSASVWAVNQLARRARADLDELLALGASLRAGERALVRGGAADNFMAQARTARQRAAALARRAEGWLEEAGQKATPTLGRKMAQTLHAAAIGDDETRAALAAGRLAQDLAPPSDFGAGGRAAMATVAGDDVAAALAASLGAGAKAAAPKPSAGAAHLRRVDERPRVDERGGAAGAKRPGTVAERARIAAERARAAAEPTRAAAERTRADLERKQAAAALREQRRAQAAARKQVALLRRRADAADRVVAERARAVDKARLAVERAEAELRAAKDALVDATTAAAAARRAADDAEG